MAMSNSSKSAGRTPPFVLVALVLLVVVLGYNYWTMSSSNKTLRQMNDKLELETKQSSEKRLATEKNLESAREELRVLQGNLEQVKKSLQDREIEMNAGKAEQKKAIDELNHCKESLAKCDADLQVEKTNVDKITAEKTQLETDLQAAKSAPKPECGDAECLKPSKAIVELLTKAVGTDAATKTLADAGKDAGKLMEGLARVEAPVQPKPEQVKEQHAGVQNDTNQVPSALHATSASKNASENLKFVSDELINANARKIEDVQMKDLGQHQPQAIQQDNLKPDNVIPERKETLTTEIPMANGKLINEATIPNVVLSTEKVPPSVEQNFQ